MKKTKFIIVTLITIISVVLMMMAGFTACPQTTTTEETTTTTVVYTYFETTSIYTITDPSWDYFAGGWGDPTKIEGKFVIVMTPSNIEVTADVPFYGVPGYGYGNFSFDRTTDVTTTEKELTSDERGKPKPTIRAYIQKSSDNKVLFRLYPSKLLVNNGNPFDYDIIEAKNNATGLNNTIFKSLKGYDCYVVGEFSNLFGTPISVDFWGQKISKMTKK